MAKEKISSAVINRLPAYLRVFEELHAKGIKSVNSSTISEIMGTTASQVRQDFLNFGGFGRQGYGYDVAYLCEQLRQIMGIDGFYNMVVLGGGKIGQALANYQNFLELGFNIKAVFDLEPWRVRVPSKIDVFGMDELEEYAKQSKIDIAIVCTPSANAQEVAELAIKCGIGAIWNFSSTEINIEGATIQNVNLNDSLFLLTYKMTNKE